MLAYRGDAFRIVRGAGGWRGLPAERPVFVFQCYLDDSGTSGLPIITLGGFVAGMNNWERVEPKIDAVMRSHGIETFHAKQFHDTDPPFRGWKIVRKKSFTEEVFSACHNELLGISIAIEKDGIKKGKQEQPGAFDRMSATGACFSGIMMKLVTHAQLGPAIKEHGISFLIETGNRNNSELEKHFHAMAKVPAYEGTLRSISFIQKNSCRAIQLADFFVFYSRRRLRNEFRFKGRVDLPPCPYLSIMSQHGPLHHDLGAVRPNPSLYKGVGGGFVVEVFV